MNELIQKFEFHLKSDKHASDNTVCSYISDISKFVCFTNSKLEKISERSIKQYISHIQRAGKSPSTTNRTLASLRAFCSFLVTIGILSESPMINIKSVKEKKSLPRTLTSEEVDLFLSQPKCDSLKGCRDRAMLELLYATGIRVSELVSLNLDDINTNVGFIRCKSESSERLIPLHQTAVLAIDNYIKTTRPLLLNSRMEKALFVNLNGTRITRQGFWKIIKFYQQEAKIKTDITPHTLRHSFALHLLEKGADLSTIKEILGYSDATSASVYAQLIKESFENSYIKLHPRAQ